MLAFICATPEVLARHQVQSHKLAYAFSWNIAVIAVFGGQIAPHVTIISLHAPPFRQPLFCCSSLSEENYVYVSSELCSEWTTFSIFKT